MASIRAKVAEWGDVAKFGDNSPRLRGQFILRGAYAANREPDVLVAADAGWKDAGRGEVQDVRAGTIALRSRPVVRAPTALVRARLIPVPGEYKIIRVFTEIIGCCEAASIAY